LHGAGQQVGASPRRAARISYLWIPVGSSVETDLTRDAAKASHAKREI
jgi:hypothetical protein